MSCLLGLGPPWVGLVNLTLAPALMPWGLSGGGACYSFRFILLC